MNFRNITRTYIAKRIIRITNVLLKNPHAQRSEQLHVYNSSVSHRINIKGGGVHQCYMTTMFNQCCKTVFFKINFEIEGWGSTMIPPFRGNTAISNY